jgi:arylsulfatase A-like enzyme
VWRTGERSSVYSVMDPLKIEIGRATLPSILKTRGYATAVIGKWHLGFGQAEKVDYTKPLRPGPLDLGFDHSFLVAQNHGDITGVYIEDDKVAGLRSGEFKAAGNSTYGPPYLGLDAPQRKNEGVMEVLTDQALNWIGKPRAGKPFFLYFSPVAVHEPITPSNKTSGQAACGPYCDFIVDLDISVGRILNELDRRGLAKNTVVLFTSDNGGELGRPEGAQRKAAEAGLALNGRWRGGKHDVWEGGLRVPYIVRWPGKVLAGSVTDQMVNLVDTVATLAALAGARLPDEAIAFEDSLNVLSAWLGTTSEPVRRAMMTNSEDGVFSLRQGPWKWIEGAPDPVKSFGPKHPRSAQFQPQLYNLRDDPGETRNVMGQNQEVAQALSTLLDECRFGGRSRTRLTATPEIGTAKKPR